MANDIFTGKICCFYYKPSHRVVKILWLGFFVSFAVAILWRLIIVQSNTQIDSYTFRNAIFCY